MELLNRNEIKAEDLVYYPSMTDWKPMSEVFDFHVGDPKFVEEGQDPEVSAESYSLIKQIKEPEEDIYYVAVQFVG